MRQLERFFDFGYADNAAVMVNNYDWTQGLSTLEFLRDVGKHFSVNRMLDREAVAARLAGPGISYTEFSYQLLQSYDYLQLHQQLGCSLQTGGSDQWGNIVAGVDLVRRVTGDRVHALTTPLVTKADGTKFGKTETGTVWLDADLTSPYAFFQFWLNAEDALVAPRCCGCFSFRSHEEIEALEAVAAERPQAREAQRALAQELTDLVHGARRAGPGRGRGARRCSARASVGPLDLATLEAALAEAPHADSARAGSGREGLARRRRPRAQRARGVQGRPAVAPSPRAAPTSRTCGCAEPDAVLTDADLLHGRWILLRRGRRHIGGIRVNRGLSWCAARCVARRAVAENTMCRKRFSGAIERMRHARVARI